MLNNVFRLYNYVTKNKRHFELMALLEEEPDETITAWIFNNSYAEDYSDRYAYLKWDKLWIITNEFNVPLQMFTGTLDISNIWDTELIAHISDDYVISGINTDLAVLEEIVENWGVNWLNLPIKCWDKSPWDTFEVDWIIYTVVDNQMLYDKIESNDIAFYETACTSLVTDMNTADAYNGWVFYNATINPDLSHWDTSNVTDMSYMFRDASVFNQPLNLDTSNVTSMYCMFYNAYSFNQPLKWDTSNVTKMSYMFYKANSFNQQLSFDTSKVTKTDKMFMLASSFDQSLDFNTSSITNMNDMFDSDSNFNQDISTWCVSNIDSKPDDFDKDSWFEWEDSKQPEWGTCP